MPVPQTSVDWTGLMIVVWSSMAIALLVFVVLLVACVLSRNSGPLDLDRK